MIGDYRWLTNFWAKLDLTTWVNGDVWRRFLMGNRTLPLGQIGVWFHGRFGVPFWLEMLKIFRDLTVTQRRRCRRWFHKILTGRWWQSRSALIQAYWTWWFDRIFRFGLTNGVATSPEPVFLHRIETFVDAMLRPGKDVLLVWGSDQDWSVYSILRLSYTK